MQWDAIVIGGGVNGLVCAAYLAKAGRRTLVLEARAEAGGCAASSEIHPGFRVPLLAHTTGPLRRDVVRDLGLEKRLTFLQPEIELAALDPNGGALLLSRDHDRTRQEIRRRAPRDAQGWNGFLQSRQAIAGLLASLFEATPPSLDAVHGRDLWQGLHAARLFRKLPRQDAYRALRWLPMPAADLVAEQFEDDLLSATLAADGTFGAMLGPWSAGSGLALLLGAANEVAAHPGSRWIQGGPGALANALVATVREAGGEVRTGAPVAQVIVRDERARGVRLATGEELLASRTVSALDPRQTLLGLCDPVDLSPDLLWRARNYRVRGTLAKVNLALSALPAFRNVDAVALSGRVRLAPSIDFLERAFDHAKYGRFSSEPWIELTIPSLLDPTLTPPQGGHVLSAYVQFVPCTLASGEWSTEQDALLAAVVRTLEQYAPGISSLVVARQVVTPADLEAGWGLSGGHIFHGELALDQLFIARPLLGFAQYRSPIDNLWWCGSGTHPGTGLTGGSGANAAKAILRGSDRQR